MGKESKPPAPEESESEGKWIVYRPPQGMIEAMNSPNRQAFLNGANAPVEKDQSILWPEGWQTDSISKSASLLRSPAGQEFEVKQHHKMERQISKQKRERQVKVHSMWQANELTIKEMATALYVGEATIKRDLDELGLSKKRR